MKDSKMKNELFDYILKRHGYYEAKFEILFNRSKSDKKSSHDIKTTTIQINQDKNIERIDLQIQNSKDKINNFKQKLLEEERNLLSLYNIKNKK
jgi:hypothetical protein